MTFLHRYLMLAIVSGFSAINTIKPAVAQVSSIEWVMYQPRFINDIPVFPYGMGMGYPSVIGFDEEGISAPTGYANEDVWRFSNDAFTAYQFQSNDFFRVSMIVILSGTPGTRKEAGFLLGAMGEEGKFAVNTDAHEIAVFGGTLPPFAFPATYNDGDSVSLGIRYFLDDYGKRAVVYTANGIQSPTFEFNNPEQGAGEGTTLGGYLLVVNDSSNTNNSGHVLFENIVIVEELYIERPQLSLSRSGPSLVVSWPESATNFTLQSASSLTSANWIDQSTVSSSFQVAPTNTAQFFRLVLRR